MISPNEVREKLNIVISEFGIKVNFIARKLGWDYYTMIKFKNNQYNYIPIRLEKLSAFLDSYYK